MNATSAGTGSLTRYRKTEIEILTAAIDIADNDAYLILITSETQLPFFVQKPCL
jgi:hypothetical protein